MGTSKMQKAFGLIQVLLIAVVLGICVGLVLINIVKAEVDNKQRVTAAAASTGTLSTKLASKVDEPPLLPRNVAWAMANELGAGAYWDVPEGTVVEGQAVDLRAERPTVHEAGSAMTVGSYWLVNKGTVISKLPLGVDTVVFVSGDVDMAAAMSMCQVTCEKGFFACCWKNENTGPRCQCFKNGTIPGHSSGAAIPDPIPVNGCTAGGNGSSSCSIGN